MRVGQYRRLCAEAPDVTEQSQGIVRSIAVQVHEAIRYLPLPGRGAADPSDYQDRTGPDDHALLELGLLGLCSQSSMHDGQGTPYQSLGA